MIRSTRKTLTLAAAVVAMCAGLLSSENWLLGGALVSSAEARIGRPLTPMSYAGVARRTTRRAVAVGAAATAGAVAYGTAGCAQVVDAYGRVVTRCY